MLKNYELIIADTSCLILLDEINELHLLNQLFAIVHITPEIADEFKSPLPSFIRISKPENTKLVQQLTKKIDLGEASALALAKESNSALLIIDDLKGRMLAKEMGLNFTGTLGIIVMAKDTGILKKIKPIFDKIQKTNFRASKSLYIQLLNHCGE